MKKRSITILMTLVFVGIALFSWYSHGGQLASTVFAVGDLLIDWGVPSGDPIFTVTNMLPGDVEERDVNITNNAAVARPIGVRGDLLSESPLFSTVIDFVIEENGSDIYGGTSVTGPKTLLDFFNETATPSSIPLSTLAPGDSTIYTFRATFDETAGNEFQNAFVIFNLIIGIDTDIPAECSLIEFSGPPIYGTDGNDRLRGTLGNDLIFALEGNDRVTAFGGDDCIIGGPGNDELRGEVGKDIIFGNEGNDLVIGADGVDTLYGGTGNDTIRGENSNDYIEGNEGNDTITGGAGADEIYGNDGNDTIDGEAGHDVIYGNEGNDALDGGAGNDTIHGNQGVDTLHGKAGNDTLIGDEDADNANGWSGTDTCIAEIETNCEL